MVTHLLDSKSVIFSGTIFLSYILLGFLGDFASQGLIIMYTYIYIYENEGWWKYIYIYI